MTDFDETVGLGAVDSDGERFAFHCTQIADGTRRIEVGTEVTFTLLAGRLGRWEAGAVTRRTAP